MRVSVSENFKIWRWIGFLFFRIKKSSGGEGEDVLTLGRKLSAFDPQWTWSNLTSPLPAFWLDPLRCWAKAREDSDGENESKRPRHYRFEQEGGLLSQATWFSRHRRKASSWS